jgi:excinuclease ABC A subunit
MERLNSGIIEVIGADANNLRDVDVHFPIGGISMVVGVSGSGKSSLLRNVLAAEGNQRLKDFLGIGQNHLDPPMNHAFVGALPATVHVGQRAFRASSRTTVGTASGLLSLLRQMFLRWSQPVSQETGQPVKRPNVADYADWLLEHHSGSIVVWAIPLSFVANDGMDMAQRLLDLGLKSVTVRSETDSPQQWEKGRLIPLVNFKPLSPKTRHLAEVEIGRLKLGKRTVKNDQKLLNLLSLAFEAGEGKVFVETGRSTIDDIQGPNGPGLDSRYHWVTPTDSRIYRPADHHLLSFNAPDHEASGACPECRGLGKTSTIDLDVLINNPQRSMHQGACALWTSKNYKLVNIQHGTIEGLRGIAGFDPDIPWNQLSKDAQDLVLNGSGKTLVTDLEPCTLRKMSKPRPYPGLVTSIMKHISKGSKTGERLAFLIRDSRCPQCQGTRWSHAARSLILGNQTIDGLLQTNFDELAALCQSSSHFARALPPDAAPFLAQLARLSESLVGVGLSHLSADRGMLEVSEGESRRIRLAAVLDGRHHGLCLLLDEPARGLHDEDVLRLTETLELLRGQHTLIINEHRQRLAHAADHFIQLGPGGGPNGGTITHNGPVPAQWWEPPEEMKRVARPVDVNRPHLLIRGACRHNIRNQDVTIPLGHLICITGISGSGKSSFVHGVLKPALNNPQYPDTQGWYEIEGVQHIDGVISLDQGTPATNRHSTVATFLDLAKGLRNHYGKLPQARRAKLDARDFGLNSGLGRCSECLGIGETKDSEHWIPCSSCGGTRFGSLVLSIHDHGLNFAQLLDKTMDELLDLLPPAVVPFIPLLESIANLGLGHLSLGRRLDTLSGGEIQRLRIARQLNIKNPHGFVLLLDEPASGLHKRDVANLLKALDHVLADGKNTVILVEHNLSIVAASDWIIEFGPGSGPKGGIVVATGSPDQLRQTDTATGRMLRSLGKPVAEKSPSQSMPNEEAVVEIDTATAASTLRWLRRLLGDDIPPKALSQGAIVSTPTVVFQTDKLDQTRLIQYGGLDRELLALMLELQMISDTRFCAQSILDCWQEHPKAQLIVHPLVQDIYVWGSHLPTSIIEERSKQLAAQGYQWFEAEDLAQIRVGGGPFHCPEDASIQRRQEAFDTAIAVGGGYVELRDGEYLLQSHTKRPIDLQSRLVGPLRISPYDLQHTGQRGKCIACKGRGQVTSYDVHLIFGSTAYPIEEKTCLHPQALEILKGVHRNILLPFLRRMDKEGLWPAQKPVADWSPKELDLILHGFWCRPGPGSFLKTAKSDPNEVASWLRWDGLFHHLHENLDHGSQDWRQQFLESARDQTCPTCDGLGLRPYVRLITFGGQHYGEWIKQGTVKGLWDALHKIQPESSRLKHRRERLLAILAILMEKDLGKTFLFQPLTPDAAAQFVPQVVSQFTRMPFLMEPYQ